MTITKTLSSYKKLNGGKKFIEVLEKLPLLTDEYLNKLKTTDEELNRLELKCLKTKKQNGRI